MLELLLNATPVTSKIKGDFVLKQSSQSQTRQWAVPPDVRSICVVCVGHGAMGGGGLSWRNNIPVTPGEILTLDFTVSTTDTRTGGSSRLLRGSKVLCIAHAGGWGPDANSFVHSGYGGKNAHPINDGGGDGGWGRNYAKQGGNAGGGAGGYLGAGGNAAVSLTDNTTGISGSGSGGGSRSKTTTWIRGGNVGLYGIGETGAGAPPNVYTDGKDGSIAEVMCGGARGYYDRYFNGGIRIIWGEGVSYPRDAV